MIKNYKDGDKPKAICNTCHKVVDTTVRSGVYESRGKKYSDIQQAFCDTCGSPVLLTHRGSVELNRQIKS